MLRFSGRLFNPLRRARAVPRLIAALALAIAAAQAPKAGSQQVSFPIQSDRLPSAPQPHSRACSN